MVPFSSGTNTVAVARTLFLEKLPENLHVRGRRLALKSARMARSVAARAPRGGTAIGPLRLFPAWSKISIVTSIGLFPRLTISHLRNAPAAALGPFSGLSGPPHSSVAEATALNPRTNAVARVVLRAHRFLLMPSRRSDWSEQCSEAQTASPAVGASSPAPRRGIHAKSTQAPRSASPTSACRSVHSSRALERNQNPAARRSHDASTIK